MTTAYNLAINTADIGISASVTRCDIYLRRSSVFDSFVIVPNFKVTVPLVNGVGSIQLLPNYVGSVYEAMFYRGANRVMQCYFIMLDIDCVLAELDLLTSWNGSGGIGNSGVDKLVKLGDIDPLSIQPSQFIQSYLDAGENTRFKFVDLNWSLVQNKPSIVSDIAAITGADGDSLFKVAGVWVNRTAAQVKAALSLAKADVGLGSVDNTTDLNKPISNATLDSLMGVRSDLSLVSSAATKKVALSNPLSIVSQPSTANLADPNVTDALLANFAAQTWRVYNPGGSLSAQSSSTLGSFAVTRKYPVTAGATYTISMHGAPSGFFFYFSGTPTIYFFDAAGAYVSALTTFTSTYGGRQVTFTVPASCAKVAFNIRDSIDFSNTVPMDSATLQSCLTNIMLNSGSSALAWSAYTSAAYAPTTALFAEVVTGSVIVAKQGYFTYIRAPCQQSSDTDVVWCLIYGRPFNYNLVNGRSGSVDFNGIRFIPRATAAINTIAAFNTSTHVHSQGSDEGCPVKYNSVYMGGAGHNAVGQTATKSLHDKTNVDVGSTWTDGTNTWVLTYIEDANKVLFMRRYSGAVDKWTIASSVIAGTTLTHVAGATHTSTYTFTAQVQNQLMPALSNTVNQLILDGVAITADGVYSGSNVRMRELYSIVNPADLQDKLIAAVGASSPNYLAGSEQIRCFNEYSWNDFGAMQIRAAQGVSQAFNRNTGTTNDYWGAVQLQRISKTVDVPAAGISTATSLYIPDVSTVSGYNFQSIADISGNATIVNIPKSSCANPSDPASHFAIFGNASGAVTSGHLFGISRGEGLGIPATRAAAITNVMFFSSANKQYPVLIDSTAGASTVGEVDIATVFRAPFLPTDVDLTVPAIVVTMSGVDYIYITAHKNLTNKSVALPSRLKGKAITIVKAHANVTVLDSYVANGLIRITVINGYGDIVLSVS